MVNIFKQTTKEIYEITTGSQKIRVTSEHPFYIVGKGWVTAKVLKINDRFKTCENEVFEQIITTFSKAQPLTVYNLEVDNNHNYFITSSKILVHNKNKEFLQYLNWDNKSILKK